jgi:hypothetical protein
LEYDSRRWCRASAFPSHADNRRSTGPLTEAHEDMFIGPQHTFTLRGNLRFPQAVPTDGELQFTLPDMLEVPPISLPGNVNESICKFGGPDPQRIAVNQLQLLLYAAYRKKQTS